MHALVRSWFAMFAVALSVAALPSQVPNTNGEPGFWLPAFPHGVHSVGCPGATARFYPIHAALIPKGTFEGCVLVWEMGGDAACRYTSPTFPHSADTDVRWAIVDPRVNPPLVHHFAWRVAIADAPPPPCNSPALGHQGLFCGGHCWLPDGRLLVAGGDYWAQAGCGIATSFAGSRIVMVFDPNDVNVAQPYQAMNGPGPGNPWRSLHSDPISSNQVRLIHPRWYPAVTLMAPSNMTLNPFVYISVAGGIERFEGAVGPNGLLANPAPLAGDPAFNTHELLRWDLSNGLITRDPRPGPAPGMNGLFSGPTTPSSAGLSFYYYPRLHFVSARPGSPDGRLWMAGMVAQSADADVINAPGNWTNGNTLSIGAGNTLLEESTVVMFPPISPAYRDWQVAIGGMKTTNAHGGSNITNECYIMPTRGAPPNWVPALPMQHPRKFPNAVILPDASILVIGGGTNPAHGVPGQAQFEPELFFNGAWYRLSNQATERTYHSVALLLPDGRVFSAGGDTCSPGAEYEIFEPPYLQGAPARPAFVGSPPAIIRYGQQHTFQVSAPFGQSVKDVVLLRPGSVTHSQDPGQRYEPLTWFVPNPPDDQNDAITVVGPANPTLIPPGFCMMFLVSSAGVPSVAHWVQLLP